MGKRRHARELALQFLYQCDVLKEFSANRSVGDDFLYCFWNENRFRHDDDVKEFFYILARGSRTNLANIDEIIVNYSENWRLSRMSNIDRNILRIAIYELVYLSSIPSAVTINEAVELGKTFGTEYSGAFVNGILDKVRISLEGE